MRIAIFTVLAIGVLALSAITLLWNPFGLFTSTASAQQENQILFVGAGFNQTNVLRGSNVTGYFSINSTSAGRIQFTLGDETYYPSSSLSNGTLGHSVHTFQSGFIGVNGVRFGFASSKLCNATIASTQTNGSTVTAYATCNAQTTPTVITTGFIHLSTAGVWQFDYSLKVPSNATVGTYLVDILIQNSSDQNFADLSNNLVYVLTVNVAQ